MQNRAQTQTKTVIHLPDTLDEALERLEGLGRLMTAKKWERAAILSCLVRLSGPGQNQHTKSYGTSAIALSVTELAAKSIHGLTSHHTVQRYVQNWLDVNDGHYPSLGEDVALPTTPWPTKEESAARRAPSPPPKPSSPPKLSPPSPTVTAVAKALASPVFRQEVIKELSTHQTNEPLKKDLRSSLLADAVAAAVDKPPPFLKPPPTVGISEAELRAQRLLSRLSTVLEEIEVETSRHPDVWADHATRLVNESNRLANITALQQPIPDDLGELP